MIEDLERTLADALCRRHTRATARLGGALDDLGGALRKKAGTGNRRRA